MPTEPLEYASPGSQQPRSTDLGAAPAPVQAVFDTVAGPNLRLRDNLVQLACIASGTLLAAGLGALFARDPLGGLMVGGFIGLLGSLLLSGLVLGIVRSISAAKTLAGQRPIPPAPAAPPPRQNP